MKTSPENTGAGQDDQWEETANHSGQRSLDTPSSPAAGQRLLCALKLPSSFVLGGPRLPEAPAQAHTHTHRHALPAGSPSRAVVLALT